MVPHVRGIDEGRPFRFTADWIALVVGWVTETVTRDFGFLRSRWSCGTLYLLIRDVHGVAVRRWLHQGCLAYRRPRSVLGPTDQQRETKLAILQRLLADLPANETAVFQDELDINTNPKIGSMWMAKGCQATVATPGNNEKRHLSGSIHWRTDQIFLTEGRPKQGRDTALLLAHLGDLRSRLRRYTKIHVICDNAKCHTSEAIAIYLWEHRDRIELSCTSCQPIAQTVIRSGGSGGICMTR